MPVSEAGGRMSEGMPERPHPTSDLRHPTSDDESCYMKLKLSILLIVAADGSRRDPAACGGADRPRLAGLRQGSRRAAIFAADADHASERSHAGAGVDVRHARARPSGHADRCRRGDVCDGRLHRFCARARDGQDHLDLHRRRPRQQARSGVLAWRFHGPAASVLRCRRWPHDGARRQDRRARHGLRHGRVRRPEAERAGRRRRAVQVDHATGHLQGHRHHGRRQRGGRAQHRVVRRSPGMGRAHAASCSGRSTPYRDRANRASRPGNTTAGRTDRGPTRGRSSPSMSSAGSSSRRRAHRRRTSTAAIERDRICTATR